MKFQEKFKTDELLIFRNSHWTWSLRPIQLTLGASVVSLNRDCTSFENLTEDESSSYGNLIKYIETVYAETFQPHKLNYLTLMLVDDQLHTHIIPRYTQPVDFKGLRYCDPYWPSIPNMGGDCIINQPEKLSACANYLAAHAKL